MGISGTRSSHSELGEAGSHGDLLALGLEGLVKLDGVGLWSWRTSRGLITCLLQPEEACLGHQQVGPREVLLLGLW